MQMIPQHHFELLALYNLTMNAKLYDVAACLTPDELMMDRGAFFRSIFGTLNHLVVADTIWLQRFATLPAPRMSIAPVLELTPPAALDQQLFDSLAAMRMRREMLDQTICSWCVTLAHEDLTSILSYRTMRGIPAQRQLGSVLLHFFNHQTHHRGQATTLLHQAGKDVGMTDLIAFMPEAVAP